MPMRSLVRCLLPVALLSLVVLLLVSVGRSEPAGGKKVALLVGVTKYDSSHFPNLKYADKDVEEMAKVLQQSGAGFTSVRVLTANRGKKDKADMPTATNIR